jgi:hypothetical protein
VTAADQQPPQSPTAAELQRFYRLKADESERLAIQRKEQITRDITRDLIFKAQGNPAFYGARDLDIELDVMVSKATSNDPVWKRHAADQQWFMTKSMMYGSEAQTALLEKLLER